MAIPLQTAVKVVSMGILVVFSFLCEPGLRLKGFQFCTIKESSRLSWKELAPESEIKLLI